MKTSTLLHYAFRARDPERLAHFYADLFEAPFFLHPVMTALGIFMVKLNHPEALFHGLLEFWPWDIVWDGSAAVFRRIPAQPSATSYGHLAIKVSNHTNQIIDELRQRGIRHRLEQRGLGLFIPVIDDPEGNMIELFPNMDQMEVPPEALCPAAQASRAIAAIRQRFTERMANRPAELGYPLFLE
jgi:catechol 2,3-dioxygenase-like lactoylglutathione lyase family enzyme